MSLRILPFRQYSEEDVVNLYRLKDGGELAATTDSGTGDADVFVKVSNGDFNADPVAYSSDSYLGKTDYPFVGRAQYPKVGLQMEAATTGSAVLGISLLQTAKADENGEKLLYNPQKAAELQAVLPGQAVPVATKGVFTVAASAVDGTLTPGTKFQISANAGKITGAAVDGALAIGTVIGTGSRASQNGETDSLAGNYYVIKLG